MLFRLQRLLMLICLGFLGNTTQVFARPDTQQILDHLPDIQLFPRYRIDDQILDRFRSEKFLKNSYSIISCADSFDPSIFTPEKYKRQLSSELEDILKLDSCLFTPFTTDYVHYTSIQPVTSNTDKKNKVLLKAFSFGGNTVFSQEELEKYLADFLFLPYSFDELVQLTNNITLLYAEKGYLTSFALLPDQNITNEVGILNIQIIEGQLEEIKIEGFDSKLTTKIKKEVSSAFSQKPLNVYELVRALQKIKKKENSINFKAELETGKLEDQNILILKNNEENPSVILSENSLPKIKPNLAKFYLEKARQNIAESNLVEAFFDFSQALEAKPDWVLVYKSRGQVYLTQKNWQLALADFNKIINLTPESTEGYKYRGIVYLKEHRFSAALTDFNKALELNPQDSEAYRGRAFVYGAQNKFVLALTDFNKALELNPKDSEAYHGRGIVYREQNELSLALSDFNKALELNPQDGLVYFNRGFIYASLQQRIKALADYNQAIKFLSNEPTAYANRGLAWFHLDNKKRAISDLDKAARLFQDQENLEGYQRVINLLKQIEENPTRIREEIFSQVNYNALPNHFPLTEIKSVS